MYIRICNHCHMEKPLTSEFFYREKLDKLGYGRRCKSCNNAVVAAYYQRHPEKKSMYTRIYSALHKAEAVIRAMAWDKANPEKAKSHRDAWAQAHPESAIAHASRRRARKRNAPVNDFTAAQWQEMKQAYGYRCAYCQKKMKRLEQEHIIPLVKGGSHTLANIVPACRSCNARKHAGPPLSPVQPLLFTIA